MAAGGPGRGQDGEQEQRDRVWVVLDSEGSEDEESGEDSWSQLRESDLVALINQVGNLSKPVQLDLLRQNWTGFKILV